MDRVPEPGEGRPDQEWTRGVPLRSPRFRTGLSDEERHVLWAVFVALRERGYDPVRQLAHFLVTGEPAYITAHRGARTLAQRLDRVRVVEELVRCYIANIETLRAAGGSAATE